MKRIALSLIVMFFSILLNAQNNPEEDLKKARHFYKEKVADSTYLHYSNVYESLTSRSLMTLDDYKHYGLICYNNKQNNQAEKVFTLGLKKAEEQNEKEDILDFQIYLGNNFKELFNYETSEKQYQTALNLAIELDDSMEIMNINYLLSILFWNQSDYKTSQNYIEVARELALKNKEEDYYMSYTYMYAQTVWRIDRDQDVLKIYKDLVDYWKAKNRPQRLVYPVFGLANTYAEIEDYDNAVKYSNEALELSYELKELYLRLKAFEFLAHYSTNIEASRPYQEKYVNLRDSLQELNIKQVEDFAHLAYETEKKEAENLAMKLELEIEQTEKLGVIILSLIGLALAIVIILYVRKIWGSKLKDLKIRKLQETEAIRDGFSKTLHDELASELIFIQNHIEDGSLMKRFKALSSKVRNLSHNIAKTDDDLNLEESFKNLLVDYFGTKCKLKLKDFDAEDWVDVDIFVKKNIYLIVVESVRNAANHGDATQIEISLSKKGKKVELLIEDNGKGFDTESKASGIGLKNMKSRAEDLNGEIQIKSEIGEGSIIKVKFKL
ncbi:ATP-binding protein [Flavobacteriaceae bacterium]|nr:ATP-binding protein [Flavobacteriaceae bacterium]